MAKVATTLDEWLQNASTYQQLLADMDIEAPVVLWADDIAVPLATQQGEDLIPFLQDALQHTREVLRSYGFCLNFAKGKTCAVLSFKGERAGELRKAHQLHGHTGIRCAFPDGQEAWLHVASTYRHLGALFASSHVIDCELRARVGIAKTAFAQLKRPILTNKNLPVHTRLQLFHALIATKLFFGLGSWITPAPKQLQYLQTTLTHMLKQVLRVGAVHMPDDQILAMAKLSDVRSRLAVERLLYAQRLFQTGPPFLHNLLQKEYECRDNSWLHGLRADLHWLDAISPEVLPHDWHKDMSPLFDTWLDSRSKWNSVIKSTWRKHVLQCHIMSDAKRLIQRALVELLSHAQK